MSDLLLRLAVRLVAASFAFFPVAFRDRYQSDALRYFADRAREVLKRKGPAGLVVLTGRNVADAVKAGLAERRSSVSGRIDASGGWPGGFAGEVRSAVRSLRKRPGFLVASAVPVALGIAGVTAVFAVVDGVLLRPLPYPDPGELVAIGRPLANGVLAGVSSANLIDLEGSVPALESVAGMLGGSVVVEGDDPEIVRVARPTRAFMEVFGVAPALGRSFRPEEFENPTVALITWRFWQRRWGGSAAVLGSDIRTDNGTFEIVGVLPRGWRGPEGMVGSDGELWLPLDYASPLLEVTRAFGFGSGTGRLAEGASLAMVNEQLRSVAERLWKRYPDANSERDGSAKMLEARPLRSVVAGDIGPRLALLLGAVAMLLAVACANVANLFLAHGSRREREFAVRSALGAGRARLVRQLLVESVAVALVGGTAGLALAYASLDALVALTPELPRADSVHVDLRVTLAAFLVSLVSGVAFGLVPALTASQRNPGGVLRGGSQPSRSADRVRGALVVGQVALALVLVTGGGLLVSSLFRLSRVDPGFRADGVLVMRPRVGVTGFPGGADSPEPFFRSLVASLGSVPGVRAVSGSVFVPGQTLPLKVTLEQPETRHEITRWSHTVLPGFFDVMEIPIVEGRPIDEGDVAGGMPAMVVSRSLGSELWPDRSPLGRRLTVHNGQEERTYTVVGVAGDIRNSGPRDPPEPVFYDAFYQNPWLASVDVLIRYEGDPAVIASGARAALRRVDPSVPVADMGLLPAILSEKTVEERDYAILLGIFSLIALAIAAVGVYATVSYSVTRRLREMGIRRAVGAGASDVAALVVRRAMLQAATGASAGLVLALVAARSLDSLLFEITPYDPLTYAAVCGILLVSALLACAVPALRAMRADPLDILRGD